MDDFFDEEDLSKFPLLINDPSGEHTLTEDVRQALYYAAVLHFLTNTPYFSAFDSSKITETQKQLAQAVIFHGPMKDVASARDLAISHQGVLVAPQFQWTKDSQPVWLACLTH